MRHAPPKWLEDLKGECIRNLASGTVLSVGTRTIPSFSSASARFFKRSSCCAVSILQDASRILSIAHAHSAARGGATCAMFALIAHRGFSSRAPENTLAAFELALEHGFQNIETDTQLCKDGAVVVHDEQLGRVNDGVGCVATATLEYLATLDAGKWFSSEHAGERIPALEELLRRYHGRRVHLHLVGAAHQVVSCASL